MPICHKSLLGIAPSACFSHVPEARTYYSATNSSWEKTLLLDFLMSRRREPTVLPQIPARKRLFCLIFSCPGNDNLPFCHRFQLGKDSSACLSHVPETITYRSATDSSWEKTLLLDFLMSRRREPTVLPQIPARKRLFCLIFSCPGNDNLPFCHRFQLGKDSSACLSHVPETITYRSATDSSWEKTLLLDFLMSRRREPTVLPQIPTGNSPFCLLFSCPGDDTTPFCHRFHPEQTQRQDSKESKRTVPIDSKNESI